MAYTSGGKATFVDKGIYSSTVTYRRLDYVKHLDCVFVARRTTIGNAPNPNVDTADWMKFVSLEVINHFSDESGVVAPSEPGVQFMNGSIVDDPENGLTKITIGITEAEWTAIQNILV